MLKKTLLSLLFSLLFTPFIANAQEADSILVEKAVLNYIENFFENKFDQMNKSLHPRLAKRGLNPDRSISDDFPPEVLKQLMSNKQPLPLSAQKNKVTDIRVFRNAATASLVTGYPRTRWVEFIHLVKTDGEWKIINVFWEYLGE